jgi:tetratricopeptide (TPR) repeat protein
VQSVFWTRARKGGLVALAVAFVLSAAVPALAQRGAIRGKISDPDGNPVPDVEVSIVLMDGGGRPIRVKTNDKGEFLRAGIPVQMYRVSFELEGWEPLQAMVTVSNGGQSFINETLHPLPEGVLSQEQADRANGHQQAAQEAFQGGDFQRAVTEWNGFIELLPKEAPAYFNLAAAQERLGDLPAAIESYEQAYALDDSMLDAVMAVGDLHGRQKEWEQALQAFDRAMERVEGNAVNLFNYAVYASNAQKVELADEFYQKAALADPEFAPAHLQIGMARAREEDREGAIAAFERFLELDPDGAQAVMVQEILDQLRNPGS